MFYLISLFPQPALSFGILSKHPLFEIFQVSFDSQKAIIMLSCDAFIYLALYFYLDEVLIFYFNFIYTKKRSSQMNLELKSIRCSFWIFYVNVLKKKKMMSLENL